MTDRPIKVIKNVATGETITREFNDKEMVQWEADKLAAAAEEAAEAERVAARSEARQKLADLKQQGKNVVTPDDIAKLTDALDVLLPKEE